MNEMRDIRKSPRLMGSVRLEMEYPLARAAGGPVKWLHGEGLDAVYRVTTEPSGDRVEGTLTHLFFHFNLTLPALWQHALRLEAEEALDAQEGGSYDFVVCTTCGNRWQVIDFGCSAHLLVCSNPQMPHRNAVGDRGLRLGRGHERHVDLSSFDEEGRS